ncbi:MAG: DNA primase [Tomitella sp.]|nr:DNA primase [Tomitella sp.]
MAGAHTSHLFSDVYLAELRAAVPITDIIDDYVDLHPAGAGKLKGLCPFHSERTPSFFVNTVWNRYHCFGCDADGDTIAFLMEADGLRFRESVTELAEKAGIDLPEAADPADEQARHDRARLSAALDAAAARMHTWLRERADARPARDFLRSRSFIGGHADTWGIGYCPPTGDALTAALTADGHHLDTLREAGLTGTHQGRRYDIFRGRIVWPLRDRKGRVVGFTGRDLSGKSRAKYLNTPETTLFRKSDLLYGLDQARPAMLREQTVILVEGQTDVMAMHAARHECTVGASGTAFTTAQADLIATSVGDGGEIITAFDNDEAGQKAAWSVFLACQPFTTNITVVSFADDGDKADACQLWGTGGADAITARVRERAPLLRTLLTRDIGSCNLATPEGKVTATRLVHERLSQVRSAVLRREYSALAADWIGVTADDVTVTKTPAPPQTGKALTSRPESSAPTASPGELQLAALLVDAPDQQATLPAGGPYAVFGKSLATIVDMATHMFPDGRPHDGPDAELWAEAMREVVDPQDEPLLWQMAFSEPLDDTDCQPTVDRLHQRHLRRRYTDLQGRIAADSTDHTTLAELADIARTLRATR